MRIAYVINSVEGGGAALPVPAIVEVLRGEGAEVALFALTRRDGRALAPIAVTGIEVQVRDGGERDHLSALRWLDRQVAQWRPTHLWTSLTRATLLGQIVGARRRLPVASWQHAAWLRPANLRLVRARRRASRLWIADSGTVADFARATIGIAPDRLALWPIFRADPAACVAAPRGQQPLRIGSLGRLHAVKGYDVLADALARLDARGVPLTVRIGGEGGARATLAGTGLELPGYVAPAEFLAGLDLYVQPSRSEGFCVAAHEAMAAGLPAIASAVGEMARTILPGETGWLVPPGNAEALAEALAAAVTAGPRLAAMGQAGRARVLALYGPERFAAAGAEVVRRLRAL